MENGLLIDFGIITVYFIGLVGLGLYTSRMIKNAEDFAYSKGRLGFPLLLGTVVAASIGASATIGRAGKAYEVGLIIFVTCVAFSIGLYLFSYLGPILRRRGIVSIPDVMEYRYGKSMRMLIAFIIPIAIIGVAGIQIIAFGLLASAFLGPLGVDYTTAVIIGAAIITLYTLVGGMMAVAYTDVGQVIIMVLALGIMLPIFLIPNLGGWSEALAILPPDPGMLLGGLSLWYLFGLLFVEIPISLVDPGLWQRSASAKSERDLVRALRLSAVLFMIWGILAVALGIWAQHLMPAIEPDSAVPTLVTEYLPPFARGLAIAALLALIMSTADTSMLVAGTTVSLDIIRPLWPNLSDRGLIRISQLTILLIGVFATVMALTVTGIFDIMIISFGIILAGTFVPIMGALFWDRAHKAGAAASVILSTAALFATQFASGAGYAPEWAQPIVVAFIVSAISFWGVSMMFAPDEKNRIPAP